MFFSSFIRSVVLLMLYKFGGGVRRLISCVSKLASLYAGAFFQLTTGLMGCSVLCILIRPFMVGAEGFMFVYFHFAFCGISVLLLFIHFLTWDWKFFCRVSLCGLKVVVLDSLEFWCHIVWLVKLIESSLCRLSLSWCRFSPVLSVWI